MEFTTEAVTFHSTVIRQYTIMVLKNLLCFLLLAVCINVAKGNVKCWVCDGKRTLKKCHAQHGHMMTCDNPTDVCQNDYRTAQGRPLITKGCKQNIACDTEVKQNKDKNQCGRTRRNKNLVCRCCCAHDGCNSKASGCIPPPAPCKKIKFLENGYPPVCDRDIDFGSQCHFRCKPGYKLVGKNRAICKRLSKGSKKGEWAPELPLCNKIIIKCIPPRTDPPNGKVRCLNSREYAKEEELNFEGTTCTYSCDANHYLAGKKSTVCGNNRRWNNDEPKCVRGSCVNKNVDQNRIEKCTEGYKFGSECTFACKKGFNLIGSKNTQCSQLGASSQGLWTKNFPRCAEVVCYPALTNPVHGSVSCTNDNLKGSVCTFSCAEGYDLDDSKLSSVSVTCEDDGDGDAIGKWSGPPATCSLIKCQPAFVDPTGGQVVCTDENRYNSVCSFSCGPGFDLDGTQTKKTVSTCTDDGDGDNVGKWSAPAATCSEVKCVPEFKNPRKGFVRCTNGNRQNSECSFHCEDRYDLDMTIDRTVTSKCLPPEDGSAKGKWTLSEAPTCTIITCDKHPMPGHGTTICSTGNHMVRTFCVTFCHRGYDLIGHTVNICHDTKRDGDSKAEWSNPIPKCRLGQCIVPKYDRETVVVDCIPAEGFPVSEYRVGTVCTYKCKNEGYYMIPNIEEDVVLSGETVAECNVEKKWTKQPPRCRVKTCLPVMETLPNGHPPKCSNGNIYNSKCEFSCVAKHALTHNRPLVCQADGDNDQYGKWSDEIPQCKRSECDDYGAIMHGSLNCTDGNKIGSICQLNCINRYTPRKYEQVHCKTTARWNKKRYVCCVGCLFNRQINLVGVYDSTAFKSLRDWQQAVDFTESILALMVGQGFEIQFAALKYSEDVDVDSVLPMRPLLNREDVSEVAFDLEDMRISGKVANTGKALTFINEQLLETTAKGREHFLLLITPGKSQDRVTEIAQTLRDRNIHILTVGVGSDEKSQKQLFDLAGNVKLILPAANLQQLRAVPERIIYISRNTGCTPASKAQSCP